MMKTLIPASWRQAFARLRDDVHQALDRWFHTNQNIDSTEHWSPTPRAVGSPLMDVEETADEVIIEAELPGLNRDDFTVELTGERLVIRGEMKRSAEQRGRGYVFTERSYGAFARAIALPCEVEPNQAKVRYNGGVLRLTLPKTSRAKAKRITVNIQS